MQIRQSSRKEILIPGRYSTGLGAPKDVTLSDLSLGGCRFALGKRSLKPGVQVQLYVGDTGPHSATVKWVKGGETGVTFAKPLSQDLLVSFQSSEVPDAANADERDVFDGNGRVKPKRYC